jgi:hypothetical protein
LITYQSTLAYHMTPVITLTGVIVTLTSCPHSFKGVSLWDLLRKPGLSCLVTYRVACKGAHFTLAEEQQQAEESTVKVEESGGAAAPMSVPRSAAAAVATVGRGLVSSLLPQRLQRSRGNAASTSRPLPPPPRLQALLQALIDRCGQPDAPHTAWLDGWLDENGLCQGPSELEIVHEARRRFHPRLYTKQQVRCLCCCSCLLLIAPVVCIDSVRRVSYGVAFVRPLCKAGLDRMPEIA